MGKYKFIEQGVLFGLMLSLTFYLIELIKLFFLPSILLSLWFNFTLWLSSILVIYFISKNEFSKVQTSSAQKFIFIFLFFQICTLSEKAFEYYLHQYYDINYSSRIAQMSVDKMVEKDLAFEKEHHAIIENKESGYSDIYEDTINKYSRKSLVGFAIIKLVFNLIIITVLYGLLKSISPTYEISINT
jgi:hypothetical protein